MSAHSSAPGLGRAQAAPAAFLTARQGSSMPTGARRTRMTGRAVTVALATLCAPLAAAVGLAAIAATGGEQQPEMGSLAGAQGLRGSTVEATPPTPATQASAPSVETPKRQGDAVAAVEKSRTEPIVTDAPDRQQSPATRAPTHKPPVRTTPTPPSPRVSPPAPLPSVDPTAPGAPTSPSGSGSSSSDSNSGSGSGTDSPDGPEGHSGGA
jgi:hypothetical protein